ncbi:hypothetical protein H4R24_000676 [Coemansia sp. RSA 988]|nr:hypothetical protein H4R24_000676 [Coemansia sp. RSA 988]
MSEILPTRTAWENIFANDGGVRVYVRPAVHPGIVKCAALGKFQPCSSVSIAEMLAFVGTSLVLFSFGGTVPTMSHICDTPVFTNILCIERFRWHDTRLSNEGLDSVNVQADQCLILSENGELVIIRIEEISTTVRLRAVERCHVTMHDINGSCPRLLRKLAVDPLTRAVAVVSWLEYIEVVLLTDENMQKLGVQLSSKRRYIATGGAICDAAFLMVSQTETQRILMVVAVLDNQGQSVFLHLYETWMHTTGSELDFVAKLPLPFDMTTPLHIVPLPAFSEEFLLITEDEVVLISALQILSGDIHLYRQKLPRCGNCVSKDLARSFCIAGTVAVTNIEEANEVQRLRVQSRSPYQKIYAAGTFPKRMCERKVAQKVYISMQSGALLRVCVSPTLQMLSIDVVEAGDRVPNTPHTFAGDVFGCLEDEQANAGSMANDAVVRSSDHLFIGGDCTDSTIVEIRTPLDCIVRDRALVMRFREDIDGLNGESVLRMHAVLPNQAPTIDIALQRDQLLMTGGRSERGTIQSMGFGHAVSTYRHAEPDAGSDQILDGAAVLRGWSVKCPSQMVVSGPATTNCVVLQCAEDIIPIVENKTGDWQVSQRMRLAIPGHQLLFITNVGREAERLLCVFNDSVDIVGNTGDSVSEDISIVQLVSAQEGEVFTHGTYVAGEDSICWVVVALWAPSKPVSADDNLKPNYTAQVRAFPVYDIDKSTPNCYTLPAEAIIENEITSLRAFAVNGENFVVVGTCMPSVHMFWLCSSTLPASLVPLSVNPLQALMSNNEPQKLDNSTLINDEAEDGAARNADVAAVSDVCIVGSSDACYILVGLRDGRLGWANISAQLMVHSHIDAAPQKIYPPALVNPGTGPITFARMGNCSTPSALYNIAGTVVVSSDSLYIARIGRQGLLEMTPCIRGVHKSKRGLREVMPLSQGRDGFGRFFAISGSDELEVIDISAEPRCLMREISVGCEPRRVVVDRETGMLLVATSAAPDSVLMLVDPACGQIYASVQMQATETVGALTTWYVEQQRTYRYVCVGTTRQTGGGRLVIYTVKATRRRTGKYELRFVWESERPNGIAALASLGDSYLVIAQGAACVILRLDVEHRQLVECCELPLRFPATSLHVRGFDVVAASERESVHLMRFTPAVNGDCERLELVHTARFGIPTADARFLSDGYIAGIGRHGCLFIAARPVGSEFAMNAVVAFHIGAECTRLRVGTLVQRLHIPHPVLAWSDSALPSCLVATTVEGAIWTAVRIADCSYALLSSLEHAMLGMPSLHPAQPLFLAADGSANRGFGRSSMQPSNAIDGSLTSLFCNTLTDIERMQVVESSPELCLQALEIAGYEPNTGNIADAISFICRLISIIDSTSVC